jgi:6,7-dimethyl-8-ribityllumazine synthase
MKKILIVQADFYAHISKLLLEGATKKITESGCEYEIITVSGALEIPTAIVFAEESKKYAGYVALGCVIRGETSHYDIVTTESARGLSKFAMKKKIAIGNGILTVENEAQAIARADPKQKNKGGFAANACIEMIRLRERFIPDQIQTSSEFGVS